MIVVAAMKSMPRYSAESFDYGMQGPLRDQLADELNQAGMPLLGIGDCIDHVLKDDLVRRMLERLIR